MSLKKVKRAELTIFYNATFIATTLRPTIRALYWQIHSRPITQRRHHVARTRWGLPLTAREQMVRVCAKIDLRKYAISVYLGYWPKICIHSRNTRSTEDTCWKLKFGYLDTVPSVHFTSNLTLNCVWKRRKWQVSQMHSLDDCTLVLIENWEFPPPKE